MKGEDSKERELWCYRYKAALAEALGPFLKVTVLSSQIRTPWESTCLAVLSILVCYLGRWPRNITVPTLTLRLDSSFLFLGADWNILFRHFFFSNFTTPGAKENYHALFSSLVDDLSKLQRGFNYNGERFHLICLGMKGDLPYLAKTGNFTRHWLRAERKVKDDTSDSKKARPAGVCWLCYAGTDEGGPWEDFNVDCRWAKVEAPEPWIERPTVLRLFHQPSCPEALFRPDIWHNYHGGVGKYFIASCLAEALSLVSGSSKNEKIHQVDELLRAWARKKGNKMPHSGGFCSERIGLTSYQVQPDASWSKHDDTRVYHKFLEDWLGSEETACLSDPVLARILWSVRSINRMFSILYRGGLWLTKSEALEAGTLGRRWLFLYAELAEIALKAGKLRFPLVVKHHLMDHHIRSMLEGSNHDWSWNCLADSVQLDEDFIGHASRIARRVSPVSQAERVLQRYLTRASREWRKPKRGVKRIGWSLRWNHLFFGSEL